MAGFLGLLVGAAVVIVCYSLGLSFFERIAR